MIMVAYITADQASFLQGKEWCADNYFNPAKDGTGNWFISEQEVRGCNVKGLDWVGKLTLEPMKSQDEDGRP